MARVLRRIVFAFIVLSLIAWAQYALIPNSVYYRDRRPTRLGKRVNDLSAALYGRLPARTRLASLETRGRRSGEPRTVPVVVTTLDGRDYLVSMLGERSEWVRNARAGGGRATLHRGGRHDVRLVEVPVGERAPILKEYLRVAPGARPHFAQTHHDPVEAFNAVAASYPVFRLEYAPVAETVTADPRIATPDRA
jgi:deazaflavin-dependent oxidoreductase (nitroreductase family)